MIFVGKVRYKLYKLVLINLLAVRDMPTKEVIHMYFCRQKT